MLSSEIIWTKRIRTFLKKAFLLLIILIKIQSDFLGTLHTCQIKDAENEFDIDILRFYN